MQENGLSMESGAAEAVEQEAAGAQAREAGQEARTERTDGGDGAFTELLKTNREFAREFDRRVQQSLETAKGKWKAEEAKRLKEAERLSKMSAEEKAAEELRAANERAEALEREKNAILLQHDTLELLAQKKLPASFVGYLVAQDAETTKERVETFEKEFRAAVEAGVNERLKGKTPAAGNGKGDTDPFLMGFMKR